MQKEVLCKVTIRQLCFTWNLYKISKNSCFRNGNGVDITYTYDNVELSVFRPKGKSYKYDVVESLVSRY